MNPTTEQANPASMGIDRLSTLEIIGVINSEDAKVAQAVKLALPQIAQAVDHITKAMSDGGRLFYVGAGTSGRLGILDAVECVPTFGTDPELVQGVIAGGADAILRAVEGAEDSRELGRSDLSAHSLRQRDIVCGIAASGRTPYVIGALEYAKSIGAGTIAISCNARSPILELADIRISAEVGPEVIAGSTRMKAGTAQKMILNMLSTTTMIKLGKVYGNLMVDVSVTNQKLADRALRLVKTLTETDDDAARRLLREAGHDVKTAVIMGRLNIDSDAARDMLRQAGGHLNKLIDGEN